MAYNCKSIFLSKVAHEFNNPLICISELIVQVIDENKRINNSVGLEQLPLIKSLSNYLLILIKDLDYFSEHQLNKDIDLNIYETDLDDILTFCIEIAKGLIKKNGKTKLNFKVVKDRNIPRKINTDEIKLKQILINLISNSIKFTNRGVICLSVVLEETDLNS